MKRSQSKSPGRVGSQIGCITVLGGNRHSESELISVGRHKRTA